MKNQNLDVIMICKGWFDKENHKSIRDALKQYYMREYAMQEQFAIDLYILEVILLPVAGEYLSKTVLTCLLLSMLRLQFDFVKKKFYVPAEGRDTALDYVINYLIAEIAGLTVKDADGRVIIDLPESKEPII